MDLEDAETEYPKRRSKEMDTLDDTDIIAADKTADQLDNYDNPPSDLDAETDSIDADDNNWADVDDYYYDF